MSIWNWLMDLWYGPVEPEKKVETFVTTPPEGWTKPKDSDILTIDVIGAGGSSKVVVKGSSTKTVKKPKATVEGNAKLLYTNNKEKKKILPEPPKTPKNKKGK